MAPVTVKRSLGMRVRRIRQDKGLTLRAVQQRAHVSATHVSEIERGKTSPTVGILQRIAAALGVPAAELLDRMPSPPPLLQRAGEQRTVLLAGGRAQARGLTQQHGPSELSVQLVHLAPEGAFEEEAPHEGEEFCYVLEGVLEVRLADVPRLVRSGEALHFRPRILHRISNPTRSAARFLWATRPRAAL